MGKIKGGNRKIQIKNSKIILLKMQNITYIDGIFNIFFREKVEKGMNGMKKVVKG